MPVGMQGGEPGQIVMMPAEQADGGQPLALPGGQQMPMGLPMMGGLAPAEPLDPSAFSKQVLDLVNQERQKAGLGALALDDNLAKAAQDKSDDMAKRNYMSHVSPEGEDPFTRMARDGAQGVAENIAEGQQSPQDVVQAWMDDPPHRANILNPMATKMGLGVADGQMRMWTQDFGV